MVRTYKYNKKKKKRKVCRIYFQVPMTPSTQRSKKHDDRTYTRSTNFYSSRKLVHHHPPCGLVERLEPSIVCLLNLSISVAAAVYKRGIRVVNITQFEIKPENKQNTQKNRIGSCSEKCFNSLYPGYRSRHTVSPAWLPYTILLITTYMCSVVHKPW